MDAPRSLARLPESELISLASSGRPDAFGELVRLYHSTVYNIAYRLVGDRQDALDLTQEAFVRAHQALESFDPARPFAPWTNRMVTNLAYNWLQRRRVPTLPLDGDALRGKVLAPGHSAEPESILLKKERGQTVRQAILALPPHFRGVIELRHFQELSYQEIAAALSIAVTEVKSHLFRARQLLREYLEKLDNISWRASLRRLAPGNRGSLPRCWQPSAPWVRCLQHGSRRHGLTCSPGARSYFRILPTCIGQVSPPHEEGLHSLRHLPPYSTSRALRFSPFFPRSPLHSDWRLSF